MRRLPSLGLAVPVGMLFLVGAAGCANSHVSTPDAGPPMFDLGPWIVDQGPAAWPPVCSSGEGCPEGLTCEQSAICLVYELMGIDTNYVSYPACVIDAPGNDYRATFTGEPCGLATPDSPMGIGLPLDICLGLNDPTSPEFATYGETFAGGCVWSDGLPVTQRAPVTACPGIFPTALSMGAYQTVLSFCGGTCGRGGCRDLISMDYEFDCVGRSDDRSFGVCAVTGQRCTAANVDARLRNACEDSWRESLLHEDAACLCMVTYPQRDDSEELTGWVVPARSCAEYQRVFPDSIECRDEDFAVVPPSP
jgi:hypothetical protein